MSLRSKTGTTRSADVKPISGSIAVDTWSLNEKHVTETVSRGAPMSNGLPCQLLLKTSHIKRNIAKSLRRGVPMVNRLPCVKTIVLRGRQGNASERYYNEPG